MDISNIIIGIIYIIDNIVDLILNFKNIRIWVLNPIISIILAIIVFLGSWVSVLLTKYLDD